MTAISDTRSHRPLLLLASLAVLHVHLLSRRRSPAVPSPPPPSPSSPSSPPPSAPSHDRADPLRAQLLHRVAELSLASDPPYTLSAGVNRGFLSPPAEAARRLLHAYLSAAGLAARTDAAGNVVADLRCDASAPRRVLALGSHYDSVRAGGRWDGVYGVLAAIAAASVVSARAPNAVCALPFDLRVVAFDDEEGNNPFGSTNFGAKAYSGTLDLATDVADLPALLRRYAQVFPGFQRRGETGEEALARRIKGAAVDSDELIGFIEVHIEQGPVLERRGAALGAVDAIAGQTRLSVTVRGEAGHAGTVPMEGRADALAAAAQGVRAVEQVGRDAAAAHGLVATVGVLSVHGGSSNVIAARVSFSVDVRARGDAARRGAVARIVRALRDLERARGVRVRVEKTHEMDAVRMTGWVRDAVQAVVVRRAEADEAVRGGCVATGAADNCTAVYEGAGAAEAREDEQVGRGAREMTSGAGHDTQLMAKVSSVGMMFVRCRGGVSHHPQEDVSDDDAFRGARALVDVIDEVAHRVRAGAGAVRV